MSLDQIADSKTSLKSAEENDSLLNSPSQSHKDSKKSPLKSPMLITA